MLVAVCVTCAQDAAIDSEQQAQLEAVSGWTIGERVESQSHSQLESQAAFDQWVRAPLRVLPTPSAVRGVCSLRRCAFVIA